MWRNNRNACNIHNISIASVYCSLYKIYNDANIVQAISVYVTDCKLLAKNHLKIFKGDMQKL